MTSCRIATVCYGATGPGAPDNFAEYTSFTSAYEFSRTSDSTFSARACLWRLDGMVVTEQMMGPNLARRIPERAGDGYVTFVALFAGSVDYRSATRVAAAAPGDIVFLDARRAFTLITGSFGQHSATISLPRTNVSDHFDLDVLEGPFQATAETGLLFDFLRSLVAALPELEVGSVRPVAGVLRSLLLMTLRQRELPAVSRPNLAARSRALAYIRTQPPGRLDVATMTAALGMTRSTLYRLFRNDGGVVACDRRRRLRLLHQALCEVPRSITVHDLANRFGFDDLSAVARGFKAQFGYTMSQIRDHLPTTPAEATAPDALQQYRAAITALA